MQLTVQWSTTEEHRNVRELFSSADMPTVWAQMIFPTGDFHCVLLFFFGKEKRSYRESRPFCAVRRKIPVLPEKRFVKRKECS